MFVPKIEEEPQRIIEQKIDQNRLVSVGTDFALLALCLLAAFVSFWDVGFSINKAFTVGWLSILIFIVSTTTYRNKYDGGIYKGRQTTEYKTATASFEKIRDFIVAKSLINTLADWCNNYRVNDLTQIQKGIVCPYMTYEEYTEKYKNLNIRKVLRCDISWKAKKQLSSQTRLCLLNCRQMDYWAFPHKQIYSASAKLSRYRAVKSASTI